MHPQQSFISRLHYSACVHKAMVGDAWRWMRGQRRDLVKFDAIAQQMHTHTRRAPQPAAVPIRHIVGSVGRTKDFTPDFMPRGSVNEDRWAGIEQAFLQGVELPPIEIYRIGDVYFINDGHHRTSVARANGCEAVDALVTTLDSPVWLTPEDFYHEQWFAKLSYPGKEVAVIDLTDNKLLQQLHEERIAQLRRDWQAGAKDQERLARLCLWLGNQLIHLGHKLRPASAVTPDTARMGEASPG